jgi:hypothetical protein
MSAIVDLEKNEKKNEDHGPSEKEELKVTVKKESLCKCIMIWAFKIICISYLSLAITVGAIYTKTACNEPFLAIYLLIMGLLGSTIYLLVMTVTHDVSTTQGKFLMWFTRFIILIFFINTCVCNFIFFRSPLSTFYEQCNTLLYLTSFISTMILDVVTVGALIGLCCFYGSVIITGKCGNIPYDKMPALVKL